MIIKARLDRDSGNMLWKEWIYIDDVSHITSSIPAKVESSKHLKENYHIRFMSRGEQQVLNVMDYSQFYIMNDNGKTLEVLRSL